MNKKIIGMILTIMMILALLPTVVAKADEYTDSNGIKYTIDPSTHTAIVAGYEGSPVDIVIPGTLTVGADDYTVTEIGSCAFRECQSLKSVTISNGITTIRDRAFSWCPNLTSVTIPDSVATIEEYAFYSSTSLSDIVIPNSVTTIGVEAFSNCSGLKSINIPASVTNMAQSVFKLCTGLEEVVLSDGVTTIPYNTFNMCYGLTSITIPASVTSIEMDAFNDCARLTTVTFLEESKVTTIGEFAFYMCSSLASIEIPEGVSQIGDNTFYGDDLLASITILSPEIAFSETLALPNGFQLNGKTVKQNQDSNEHGKTSLTISKEGVVTVNVTPDERYELDDLKYYCFDDSTRITDQTFTVPDGDFEVFARFKDKTYTVKFVNDDENHTELQSGNVRFGETPQYTGETPTKEADAQYTYTFRGWTDGTETYGKDETLPSVKGDVTYTAVYDKTVNKYDLTFDLGGGTLNGKTGTYTMNCEYGAKINLPDAPTKEGYTFKYWKGSTYAAGAEYTVDGPHDFTAEWGETLDSVSLTITPPLCGTDVFGNSWSDFYVGDTRQTPQPEVSIPSGEGYELDEDEYTNYGIWYTSEGYWVKGIMRGGNTYIAQIELRPTGDFAFADEMSISVSGGTLKDYSIYWNDGVQLLDVFVEVEALHDWGEWTVTKEPTTTEEGVETRVCKYDPTHTETRPIPKLPDDNPKTGDNGDTGLWAAIMGGALLAAIGFITAGRKYLKKQR